MPGDRIKQLEKENKLLREQVTRIQGRFEDKIAELSMVREIGMSLLYVRSFEETCRFLLDVIINNTIAQNCSVMLLDKDLNRLFLACATSPGKEPFILSSQNVFSKEHVDYSFKLGEGIAGQALKDKKPILVDEVGAAAFFSADHKSKVEVGSLLSLPLLVEDEPIGVLNLSHAGKKIFKENDVNLLQIITNFVALSIHGTLEHEQLLYSEAKYRALSENSSDAIAIIQDGTHIYANPRYLEFTGLSFKKLQTTTFVSLLERKGRSGELDSLLRGEKTNIQFEDEISHKSGSTLPVEINCSSIIYNGKYAAIIAARDQSNRLKLEKQLRHAQKMEVIGTLAGTVAHDLNNILTGLVSYPELLIIGLPKDSPLKKPLQTIQNSGMKAAAIVQDLLALARRGVTVSKVINLNTIIADYIESTEYKSIKKQYPKINIDVITDDTLFNINGAPFQLSKVIMNLLSNAAEAMLGEGTIRITTENRYVEMPQDDDAKIKEGEYAILAVSDTGIGIPAEEIDKIFEPFYTRKEMGKSGTGLGLAVVQGTISDHNGHIEVQTSPGLGTTFTMYFPAVRASIDQNSNIFSIEDYMGNGESVLVIDDMEEQREIAKDMLELIGYTVNTVSSGEMAIEYLKENTADILVLDMILGPGKTGLDAFREILKIHPGQKAIIVSGFSESSDVKETQKLGAGSYIRKPYLLRDLGLALQQELSNKK
ncbi:MAG: response regulator [Proteobacteria bacterium]|nr:response regulator [Pseudomonadota bacterium]MBU1709130.1 response regulator [Pseudomonadota bacterium]